MSHDMPTGRRIYEGKAKVLFEGPEDGTLVQYFKDDTTANAEKHEIMPAKAFSICASPNLFSELEKIGVPTHFIKRLTHASNLFAPPKLFRWKL